MAETKEQQQASGTQSAQATQTQGAQSGAQAATTGGLQGQRRGQVQQGGQGAVPVIARNPVAVVQQLSEQMDRLFESFFYGAPGRPGRQADVPWVPDIELRQEGNELVVRVDLPGVNLDDMVVDIEPGALTISGERVEQRDEGGRQQGFRRSEVHYGAFMRTIPLPDDVDTDKAVARMEGGVLEIRLPMSGRQTSRRLDVQGGGQSS